jgi:hypothetical protein
MESIGCTCKKIFFLLLISRFRSLFEICYDDISAVFKATELRFPFPFTLRQLGWIDAPHTLNFEILKSLEQTLTQDSKKIKLLN